VSAPDTSVDPDASDDEGSAASDVEPSDDGDGGDDGGKAKAPRSTTRSVIEWIAVIGGALVVALVIKTFLIQAFYIPSGSMEPTLDIGDRVLVNKLSYQLHDVNRGDLVVFEANEGNGDCGQPVSEAAATASESGIKDLIKRVIGLPGDTIDIRDDQILINDRVLEEPYIDESVTTAPNGFEFPFVVPEGCIFVMGDNRTDSRDSRIFGPIDEDQIVGRAFVRVWPLNTLGFL
jgi:signal peptidase I